MYMIRQYLIPTVSFEECNAFRCERNAIFATLSFSNFSYMNFRRSRIMQMMDMQATRTTHTEPEILPVKRVLILD